MSRSARVIRKEHFRRGGMTMTHILELISQLNQWRNWNMSLQDRLAKYEWRKSRDFQGSQVEDTPTDTSVTPHPLLVSACLFAVIPCLTGVDPLNPVYSKMIFDVGSIGTSI